MMRLDDPAVELDEQEWRAFKAMERRRRHQHRLATEPLESVRRQMLAWREAIYRDDLTDLVERELVLEEQAA